MVLSAVWHGASWTFVIWGIYNASLLTGYRIVMKRIPAKMMAVRQWRVLTVPLMFTFIVVNFIIFRETHVGRLFHYFTLNPLGGTQDQWIAATVMLAITLALGAFLMAGSLAQMFVIPKLSKSPWYLPGMTTACTAFALCMWVFQRTTSNDFIYFQF